MRLKTSGFLVLMIFVVFTGVIWGWWQKSHSPVTTVLQQKAFIVKPGMNAGMVGRELQKRNLIRSSQAFRIRSSLEKVDDQLKAGNYLLSPSMSLTEIIEELLKGPKPDFVIVTIPEGYSTAQLISTLAEKGLGTKEEFLTTIANEKFPYDFLESIPDNIGREKRLEGFLFPDTYFFEKTNSPSQIIYKILERFAKEVTPEVKNKLRQENRSIFEWITLASLVEKEAAKPEDRPTIAGVFINRLKQGMPLQSDASIQYLLDTPRPVVYFKDLEIPSPYNTYLYPGLPRGPIANPGHASLEAALNPDETEYLYFVAKGDGYHVFAKTYQEQLRNQELYQSPETKPN